MKDYVIVTDSTTDLPASYFEENHLYCMHLGCVLNGVTYNGDNPLDVHVFYDGLRKGELPTTSQVNPDDAKQVFLEAMKESKNILCLSFSSGLSGTYNSVRIAAEELMEEDSECNIVVIDTLSASVGEGLLVHYAVKLRDEGKSMEEVAQWVEENKLKSVHIVVVDDLFHLQRGGRVSKAAAVVGSMINMKPMIHVDNEGKLVKIDAVRGRKKSLHTAVDYMESHMGTMRDKNEMIFISHADCEDEAKQIADEIKSRFGIESFLINYIGTVIGSHTGTGTIALCFLGDER